MPLTFYLLSIPPILFFLILISIGGISAGLTTYLFRKFVSIKVLRSHNEVIGFLFLAIASFYSLMLSFIVFVVWGQLNETRGNVSKEGSSAMGLYRDIKFYPDFVYNVVDDEFPRMEKLELSRVTPESFNKVFYKMEHLNPKNPFQIQLVAEMFNHLNELATYRGLRISSMEDEIAPPLWLPMIFGAIITIICALLMDIEHLRIHIALNALLGVFIGMFFFIIILLPPFLVFSF